MQAPAVFLFHLNTIRGKLGLDARPDPALRREVRIRPGRFEALALDFVRLKAAPGAGPSSFGQGEQDRAAFLNLLSRGRGVAALKHLAGSGYKTPGP
jgi:hypothetical protein